MRGSWWPSPEARRRLEDVESDPHGHGFLDLKELLDLWGVIDPLPGEDLMGYEARVHPDAPEIIFYFPLREELNPPTVRAICRNLRKLRRRLSP